MQSRLHGLCVSRCRRQTEVGIASRFSVFLSPSPQAHSMPRGWSTASAEKDEEEEEEEKEEEVQDAQEI